MAVNTRRDLGFLALIALGVGVTTPLAHHLENQHAEFQQQKAAKIAQVEYSTGVVEEEEIYTNGQNLEYALKMVCLGNCPSAFPTYHIGVIDTESKPVSALALAIEEQTAQKQGTVIFIRKGLLEQHCDNAQICAVLSYEIYLRVPTKQNL